VEAGSSRLMKLQACTRLSSVEQKQLELTEFLNQGSESLPVGRQVLVTFAAKSNIEKDKRRN
jgi:hypothetical protein